MYWTESKNRTQIASRRSLFVLVVCILIIRGTLCSAQLDFTGWPAVVAVNREATILIRVEVAGKPPGFGSGVVIDPDGHILTAKHVLPESSVRAGSAFLITALIGWDDPSIDFSQAKKLDIVYVSDRYDLAILRFRSPVPSLRYAVVADTFAPAESILVMGYPDGGNLTSTVGVASRKAPDGKFGTDASVGIGNSGGPVFATSGKMVGMLLEGSRRGDDGRIVLGYFLTTETISLELTRRQSNIHLATGPLSPATVPPLPQITIAYRVDDEKIDHPSVAPTEAAFERSFWVQDGYRIVGASFQPSSANNVSKGPEVVIVEDGQRVIVRFTLRSGPIFDQWRGWLVGNITTVQQRK